MALVGEANQGGLVQKAVLTTADLRVPAAGSGEPGVSRFTVPPLSPEAVLPGIDAAVLTQPDQQEEAKRAEKREADRVAEENHAKQTERQRLDREIARVQYEIMQAHKWGEDPWKHQLSKQLKYLIAQQRLLDASPSQAGVRTFSAPYGNSIPQEQVQFMQLSPLLLLAALEATNAQPREEMPGWLGNRFPTGEGQRQFFPLPAPPPKPFELGGFRPPAVGGRVTSEELGGLVRSPGPSSPSRQQSETIIKNVSANTAERHKLTPKEAAELEKYSLAVGWEEGRLNMNTGQSKVVNKFGQRENSHGMFQINADAHPDYDVARGYRDPRYNAEYGINHLASLYKKYGSWEMAVERYNGSGPMARDYRSRVVLHAKRMDGALEPNVG